MRLYVYVYVYECVCVCVCASVRVFVWVSCLHVVPLCQSLRSLVALASSAPSPVEQFRNCL